MREESPIRIPGHRRRRWAVLCLALIVLASVYAPTQAQRARHQIVAYETHPAPATEPQDTAQLLAPGAAELVEVRELTREGRYDEAAQLAEQAVRLAEQEFGRRSREAAEAYQELAEAQRLAGRQDDAQLSHLQAIDRYRDILGPYSTQLVVPLVVLGDNYQHGGQFEFALAAYEEARIISRRAYGMLNPVQIPILDRMSAALLGMNLFAEAKAMQLAAVDLVERAHAPGSVEMLEAIYRYALWLRRARAFRDEQEQYARAIRIIRQHFGRDDEQMVRPLRETANGLRAQAATHSRHFVPDGRGPGALGRALKILEAQDAPDALTFAELLRDIGDWQTAFERALIAPDAYRRAWELLGQVEDGEELRNEWFTGLEFLLAQPIRGASSTAPDAQTGHVVLQFDLDERGRPHDVMVIDSHPPGLRDHVYMDALRRSRFRPQMENGETVHGEALTQRFVYRYLAAD